MLEEFVPFSPQDTMLGYTEIEILDEAELTPQTSNVSESIEMTEDHIRALMEGKILYLNPQREYGVYIKFKKE